MWFKWAFGYRRYGIIILLGVFDWDGLVISKERAWVVPCPFVEIDHEVPVPKSEGMDRKTWRQCIDQGIIGFGS
jgi:hypothetical protein